jgi:hypothetical protein
MFSAEKCVINKDFILVYIKTPICGSNTVFVSAQSSLQSIFFISRILLFEGLYRINPIN